LAVEFGLQCIACSGLQRYQHPAHGTALPLHRTVTGRRQPI